MKNYYLVLIAILLIASVSFLGCQRNDESDEDDWGGDGLCDACLDASPDMDQISLDIPGEDQTKGTYDTQSVLEAGDPNFYMDTRNISDSLNFWIRGHLGFMDEILSYPPSGNDGEYCFWGPFIPSGLHPVEVLFKMRQSISVNNSFDYTWQERLKNTEDPWQDIWGGDIVPATETAHRGVGNLYIDYTTAKQLDPASLPTGLMEVEYDTYSDGRQIDITFTDFAFNDFDIPTDATYSYHNHTDNAGEFEFAISADLFGGTEAELLSYTTQWISTGSGVSIQTVSGGDMDEDNSFASPIDRVEGKQCWDDLFDVFFYSQIAYLEDSTEVELKNVGDESACQD